MADISGALLKAERDCANVGQEALARAMGVSVKTVQRIEAASAVAPRNADGYRAALKRASNSRDDVARGTPDEATVPDWLERRAVSLDRELAKAGAVDSQLDYIQEILRSPATLKLVMVTDEGAPRPLEDQRQQLELFIEGLRFWLQRTATPGGAPVAPYRAVPEPKDEVIPEAQTKKK
jgi:transcriptional regulator with XRE-family HTH domain